MLIKYSGDFLENEEYDNDSYLDEDYFILLDRYYKFGITFENSDVYYKKKLYVFKDFEENPPFRYILRNRYDLNNLYLIM